MRNYFKTKSGQLFFFTDGVPESIEDAFVYATLTTEPVSVFRPAMVPGPWDACPVIGYRTRAEVLADLEHEADEELAARLEDELEDVDFCFLEAGRPVPLVAVGS